MHCVGEAGIVHVWAGIWVGGLMGRCGVYEEAAKRVTVVCEGGIVASVV